MNVMDLDEAQGLTAEMVREWMSAHGWRNSRADGHMYHAEFGTVATRDHFRVIEFLATYFARISAQALLREINPRLRPWPSAEARAAHRGPWLAVAREDGTACMGTFRRDVDWFTHSGNHILTDEDSYARFWPVDEHGQRVRWPVDAAGNML